jgi:hypothetical protein
MYKHKKTHNKKIINIRRIWKKTKIKSRELRKFLKTINSLKEKKIIWIIIWIILLILWINILIQKTIYKSENTINKISFTKADMWEYDNPYLYKDIQETLEWKNYYHYKFFRLEEFQEKLKEEYFIVEKLEIQKTKNLKYIVNIDFTKPDIIVKDWIRTVGIINGNFFDIYKGNSIWTWIINILIPEYIQNFKNFDGFFNKVKEKEFLLQMNTLNIFFEWNLDNIQYLPWWSRTIITTLDWKTIFFSNIKPLSKQLKRLYILQNDNNLYNTYNEIDLGSLDEIIVK